ncbi:hypothetical protein M885DRAFT_516499 [Pelagophyceae sp. CCMP2097]|nr:hypothetical protein M885DRAFT_516499 [Pelagophyceae sp. CCMP2097]|mmetsp:Transcript_20767/g.71366  ORF Transcript_20767/g.71366 Transcript_20767/m.71366 type:complete len:318 (+) Transcript_20767:121-1074(+)
MVYEPPKAGCLCCPDGGVGCCHCCYDRQCWFQSAAVGSSSFCVALILFIVALSISNAAFLGIVLLLICPTAIGLGVSGCCCLGFCTPALDARRTGDAEAPPALVEFAQVHAHTSAEQWAQPIQGYAQAVAQPGAWQGGNMQPGAQPPMQHMIQGTVIQPQGFAQPQGNFVQQLGPVVQQQPQMLQSAVVQPGNGSPARVAPDVFSVEAFVDAVQRAGTTRKRDAAKFALEGRPLPRRADEVAAALNAFSLSFEMLDVADGLADVVRLDAETAARVVQSLDAANAREEAAARLAKYMSRDEKLHLLKLIPQYGARLGF